MTEQGNGGHTPPAFAFLDEATPYTSREGGEGASGTCYDLPAYIEEYIDDALKARNRQTDATDVNDDTDNGSTNYAPVVSTASADHAWPGTSHAGIEKLSPTTKDSASCSDEAWRCLQNAQHRPIADQTYSLEGFSYSRSTSHLNPGSSSSIDHAQPSTSRAGMVEASAILEYGARNATGTGGRGQQDFIPDDAWKYQWNTQPTRTTDGTYNVDGMLLGPEEPNSESAVVSVEMFPADGTPHTGNPAIMRTAQPPCSQHIIDCLSRSRTTNAKHVVNCLAGLVT
ncbi:uncharacterized protein [Dermacentor albipictus]|uniref:uncharacterized protein isoform X3 n=1 Tax=Dermacentor albipictus TaxID=60249 RepID=UPI0031FBC0F6